MKEGKQTSDYVVRCGDQVMTIKISSMEKEFPGSTNDRWVLEEVKFNWKPYNRLIINALLIIVLVYTDWEKLSNSFMVQNPPPNLKVALFAGWRVYFLRKAVSTSNGFSR